MFDLIDVSFEVPDAAHGSSVISPSSLNRLGSFDPGQQLAVAVGHGTRSSAERTSSLRPGQKPRYTVVCRCWVTFFVKQFNKLKACSLVLANR
eukprot:s94_g41.t1